MEMKEFEQKIRKAWQQRENPKHSDKRITRFFAAVRLDKTSLEFSLGNPVFSGDKHFPLYVVIESTETKNDLKDSKNFHNEQKRIGELFKRLGNRYKKTMVPHVNNLNDKWGERVSTSAFIRRRVRNTPLLEMVIAFVEIVRKESSDQKISFAKLSFTEKIETEYDVSFQ